MYAGPHKNLEKTNWLFKGEGDPQFEVYRLMRDAVKWVN